MEINETVHGGRQNDVALLEFEEFCAWTSEKFNTALQLESYC